MDLSGPDSLLSAAAIRIHLRISSRPFVLVNSITIASQWSPDLDIGELPPINHRSHNVWISFITYSIQYRGAVGELDIY